MLAHIVRTRHIIGGEGGNGRFVRACIVLRAYGQQLTQLVGVHIAVLAIIGQIRPAVHNANNGDTRARRQGNQHVRALISLCTHLSAVRAYRTYIPVHFHAKGRRGAGIDGLARFQMAAQHIADDAAAVDICPFRIKGIHLNACALIDAAKRFALRAGLAVNRSADFGVGRPERRQLFSPHRQGNHQQRQHQRQAQESFHLVSPNAFVVMSSPFKAQ